MPSVDFYVTFNSGFDGFSATGGVTPWSCAWDSSEGDPGAGSTEFAIDLFIFGDQVSSQGARRDLTWEDMGVPAGQTVTAVQFLERRYKHNLNSPTPADPMAFSVTHSVALQALVGVTPFGLVSLSNSFSSAGAPTPGVWVAQTSSFVRPVNTTIDGGHDFTESTQALRILQSLDSQLHIGRIVGSFWQDTFGFRVFYGTDADWIDHARGLGGRLLAATIFDGALLVRRYNDDQPEAVGATTPISGTAPTTCSITARRSGIIDLLYTDGGDVRHRTSRDQGGTFGVATTIASGYEAVTHWIDEASGLLVAMIWKPNSWYVTVGTLGTDGVTWTFSTPVVAVAGQKTGASLQRRADGTFEFSHITAAGAAAIVRAKVLKADGTGAWS